MSSLPEAAASPVHPLCFSDPLPLPPHLRLPQVKQKPEKIIVPDSWIAEVWKKFQPRCKNLVKMLIHNGGEKDGAFLIMPGSSEKYPMAQLLPFTFHKVRVVPKLAKPWLELLCAHNLDCYILSAHAMEYFPWYRIGQ